MSGKRVRLARAQVQAVGEPRERRFPLIGGYLLAFALGAAAAAAVVMADQGRALPKTSSKEPPAPNPNRSLDQLLAMSPEELAKVDVAEMNLICAMGLPGSEGVDIAKCLARLDKWAARVKHETERHLYRLSDPQYKDHAEHYQHSEARFRAEWLVSVLQNDIGLHYHAGFVPQDVAVPFKTSKETFLHGLIDNEDARKSFGGNCVSMPVAYAAVGRRLGYPIKLVSSKEHVFCRWEGLDHPNARWRDRFNFDGAGNGFSIDPDEFHMTWPRASTPEQIELCDWLKSLTSRQELALFTKARGNVLECVNKDHAGAQVAYAHAMRLWPNRGGIQMMAQTLELLWEAEIAEHPDTYCRLYGPGVLAKGGQRVEPPERQPPRQIDPLAELRRIDEINRRNRELMMDSLVQPSASLVPPNRRGPGRP